MSVFGSMFVSLYAKQTEEHVKWGEVYELCMNEHAYSL